MESTDEYYRPEELVNDETVGLISWYIDTKMPEYMLRSARGRVLSTEDIRQEVAFHLLRRKYARKWASSTLICRVVYFTCQHLAEKNHRDSTLRKGFHDDIPYEPSDEVDEFGNVQAAMGVLSDRERSIVESRYGSNPKQLREISEIMGVSRQRVSQIEARAIEKMRAVLPR